VKNKLTVNLSTAAVLLKEAVDFVSAQARQQSPPRCQHFGLPASAHGAEATEVPQVTVEPGPLRILHHLKYLYNG